MAKTRYTGFTLIEVMISTGILVIISVLMYSVLQNTVSAQAVAEAEELAQTSVRNAMMMMSQEIELAAKADHPALAPPVEAIDVPNANEVTFQIPVNNTGTVWSAPITYRFINEDAEDHEGGGNGVLDEGEDVNEDGILTRHVLRIQEDSQQVVGGANDLSDVRFELNDNGDMLTITVSGTKRTTLRRHDLARATATARVYLLN